MDGTAERADVWFHFGLRLSFQELETVAELVLVVGKSVRRGKRLSQLVSESTQVGAVTVVGFGVGDFHRVRAGNGRGGVRIVDGGRGDDREGSAVTLATYSVSTHKVARSWPARFSASPARCVSSLRWLISSAQSSQGSSSGLIWLLARAVSAARWSSSSRWVCTSTNLSRGMGSAGPAGARLRGSSPACSWRLWRWWAGRRVQIQDV